MQPIHGSGTFGKQQDMVSHDKKEFKKKTFKKHTDMGVVVRRLSPPPQNGTVFRLPSPREQRKLVSASYQIC